ncbi:hypothetical protein J3459_010607 [Metarhizium acridum]|uniref:Uncharacterized protein n=1 Tax=Metarhizium acridum (strain CQMa 102) TaxID=655827 RepID=E9EGF6_METAQ|nr:uncharacterized protein MAC_08954 [Metarhizium acridum CQMa 102]EFY85022.1 hypothetical protein MAC_08954 [Metarhizium acridum CQMa 102]KAG8407363.1 hypothetical protein J3458_020843 [Metarhizium acridum]KAG8422199.1 hypothetical protein J3459_010607 [Metarhizium acridum]
MTNAQVVRLQHRQPRHNHHHLLVALQGPPPPSEPDFGLDSLPGLLFTLAGTPLYLYAALGGKFKAWHDVLDDVPTPLLLGAHGGRGIKDVRVSLLGVGIMYGILPCQLLTATKPH